MHRASDGSATLIKFIFESINPNPIIVTNKCLPLRRFAEALIGLGFRGMHLAPFVWFG